MIGSSRPALFSFKLSKLTVCNRAAGLASAAGGLLFLPLHKLLELKAPCRFGNYPFAGPGNRHGHFGLLDGMSVQTDCFAAHILGPGHSPGPGEIPGSGDNPGPGEIPGPGHNPD